VAIVLLYKKACNKMNFISVMEDIGESINGTIVRGIICNLLLIIQLNVINIPDMTYCMTSADIFR